MPSLQQLCQYREAERYLLKMPRFTQKSTPQDTANFYELLGKPGDRQKIIHVAGTNGKGSVCSYLSNLLQECGFSAGMFTSPHLIRMTERIRIGAESIGEEAFVRAFDKVKETAVHCGRCPSFFEYLFFMAMLIFEEYGTDYIILETGLGGRLDATNCILHPQVCVITSIGMDHMEYLGSTLGQIAAEKAGIIKQNCPVVYWDNNAEVSKVILKTAKARNSSVFAVNHTMVRILGKRKKSIDFSYKSRYYNYISLTVSTEAFYQTENAALAIQAMETILPEEILAEQSIRQAVEKTFWEGRMEEVLPEIYVDGAHNEDGVKAFLQSVRADGWCGGRTLLFGAVVDKRYESMLSQLLQSGLFHKAATAMLQTQRSVSGRELAVVLQRLGEGQVFCFENVEDAFRALREEQKKDERIYAAGSLYLVGQIKAMLIKEEHGYNNDKF